MKQVSDKDLCAVIKMLQDYHNHLGDEISRIESGVQQGKGWKIAERQRKVSLLIKKLSKVQFLLNAIFII